MIQAPKAKERRGGGTGPRITPAVDLLINALVNGTVCGIDDAVKVSGLGVRGVYKALERPHVRDEIKRRSLQRMSAFALPRAISVMESLLKADSEYVRADMGKHIASIHGVAPAQDKARVTTNAVTLNITIGKQPITLDAITEPDINLIESKG